LAVGRGSFRKLLKRLERQCRKVSNRERRGDGLLKIVYGVNVIFKS